MKNTFAAKTFAARSFACGTWAGVGVTAPFDPSVPEDQTWTPPARGTTWTPPTRGTTWTPSEEREV